MMTTSSPTSKNWVRTCSPATFHQLLKTINPRRHPALLRERAAADLPLFVRLALPDFARLPFAPFHRQLFAWHRRMGEPPFPDRAGLRFAVAAPRGSAKSTLASFALVLHDLAYRRERYIVLVSATQRQAQQRLAALRAELLGRGAITRFYPELCGRANVESTERALVVGGVRVEAFGCGAEMRGISHDGWRPTKIILDDAESTAAADSPRRRAKTHDWFAEVIEHLGDGATHMLAVGTILHPAGLLPALIGRPDFEGLVLPSVQAFPPPSPAWEEWRRLLSDPATPGRRAAARGYFLEHRRAMEAGTAVLWPEHEDIEHLMAQMIANGRRAFYQEKQNQPLGPEDALFEPERYWRARPATGGAVDLLPPASHGAPAQPPRRVEGPLRVFGFLDSALGKSRAQGTGDFAALARVAVAEGGLLILLDLWVKRAKPSEQVAALFAMHEELPFERLAVEGTGFQELLTLPIEEERRRRGAEGLPGADLVIEVVKPTRRKEARIAALEPLLANGRLVLGETLPEEFWEELARFPRTAHDDALDAAAGAAALAQRSAQRRGSGSDFEAESLHHAPRPGQKPLKRRDLCHG
ncbi:MAG: hypothetical protein RLY93_12645 [Sumerlaeia bacterium]